MPGDLGNRRLPQCPKECARGEASKNICRAAHSEEVRAHGKCKRGRPCGARSCRAIDSTPEDQRRLGDPFEERRLAMDEFVDQCDERCFRIAGGEVDVEAIKRPIGVREVLLSADRMHCISTDRRKINNIENFRCK